MTGGKATGDGGEDIVLGSFDSALCAPLRMTRFFLLSTTREQPQEHRQRRILHSTSLGQYLRQKQEQRQLQ
jgi:hypothetical protein